MTTVEPQNAPLGRAADIHAARSRKAYHAPRILEFGDVAGLTEVTNS